ncbi:MAG: radical SAM protein [Alphaproteobacteria bacterium]|nr:radical SAM protein [Alphaproteobacteria bacterium]
MDGSQITAQKTFLVYLIKPSHYDDDGYVIQWLRSAIPSNTLATLNGLFVDSIERQILGPDVRIEVRAFDETNTRIRPSEIIAEINANEGGGMVGFVGVQSNQFPHTMDLARPMREAGIQVCIGGFHVSGCLAMLPEVPADIQEAMDLGITIFAGEAEGRLDQVLIDAYGGNLAPSYNYMNDLPGLENAITPILPPTRISRTAGGISSFDAGRGCPFQCSFCTIINVQGRKSRRRTPDDIERIIRDNAAQGIFSFFITDDNLARNKDWEIIFDRIIKLREEEGIPVRFIIQVDTLCHEIKGFIEKAGRAGVRRVFIGLENINPDSLMSANKRQNRITDYRKMLLAWREQGIITYAGYILGFPGDTPETIVRDIEIIKRELPIDLLEFFCLTPLPGSQDHKELSAKGVWMDPDMNKYDLEHVTTGHSTMSPEEWSHAYKLAWKTYFTPEHIKTVMRRSAANGMSAGKTLFLMLWFHSCIKLEDLHPLEGGYFRRKYRRDRRPGLKRENPLIFYPRYGFEIVYKHLYLFALVIRYGAFRQLLKWDKSAKDYTDLSLTPVDDDEYNELEMFAVTDSAKAAVDKMRVKDEQREKRAAAAAE